MSPDLATFATAPSLVTVLLPVRNAARTLGLALRSLERQWMPRWECLVLDDGSTDDSLAIAQSRSRADPRIRSVALPARGLVPTLNTGLELCQSPFVARLDADDVCHAERFACQLAALEAQPALAGLGCHVRLFPRSILSDGLRKYEQWLNAVSCARDVAIERFIESPLAHPTFFFRSSALRTLGYRDMGWPEDWDCLLRAHELGMRLGTVPRRLVGWRDGPTRLSRVGAHCQPAQLLKCRAQFLVSGFLRSSERFALWGYGDTGRLLMRELAQLGRRPSYIVERHPRRIGQRILGVPVVAPDTLASIERLKVIASVAGSSQRSLVRASLVALGYAEGTDYICAA